ncbi:helix-turn-helix transcriptional regulator [Streptomyces sp. NPDC021020]|uniref:helix-turn-helix transcriptional regulator n=1 Tax=Streptomyces sp. NPDC021020 TaxID=3365109 RepID=UPI0037B148C8
MPQRPKQLEPEKSDRHWFGAELRHWRLERRLSQPQLGAKVHVSGDLIGKIEKAVRTCTPELARALEEALGTGGALTRALPRTASDADNSPSDADSSPPGTHSGPAPAAPPAILAAEGTTSTEGLRVPCRTAEGRIIFVTMPRRALLRGSAAGAVSLAAGRPDVPAGRSTAFLPDIHPVAHLQTLRRSLVECDNVLGPTGVVSTVLDHIRLIQRLRGNTSGADRLALLQVQAEYAEFCGWLFQDAGDHRTAEYWTDRALTWSHAVDNPELTAYVMARKAQLAGDMHDPVEAVDLAEAARSLAPPRSRLAAMGAMYGAHGHALNGDRTACDRAYGTALDLVSDLRDDSVRKRGSWLAPAYVQAQRAHSLSALGDHRAAADGFAAAIGTLPPAFRRDRGVYLARAAVAQARSGEPELAATTGSQALPLATETQSARIFGELAALDVELSQWGSVPAVTGFRTAFDGVVLHEI